MVAIFAKRSELNMSSGTTALKCLREGARCEKIRIICRRSKRGAGRWCCSGRILKQHADFHRNKKSPNRSSQ